MDPDFSDEEDGYTKISHCITRRSDEVTYTNVPKQEEPFPPVQPPPKCTRKKILSTNGTLKLDDGVYTGEILDGRANGRGVLMKWDGHRYEGEFINDMPDGKGILIRLHGSNSTEKIYEGRFLENKFDGQGTFYWSDGSRYQGAWKNNQRHGLGQIIYADGRVRKGQWAYDKLVEELQVSNT
ncbi:unnamed protein product [Adineta steineri]|uniref:MORN repeat-containing protein 3 n=1 Tax=Adineta steineri TaxID=433720 RepID=A0A813TRN7_9BILA|nr:unnamed protein product [Adineta steineri]CAF3637641.1 unnamed protein product [Adineta steineri]